VLLGGSSALAFTFQTVKIPNSNGFSEPRVTVDPAGHMWLESNAGDGSAAVWGSMDGLTWKQTPTEPAGQTAATTDVDIVTLPSGRIVETELDDGGINFRTSYSDDGGKTWTLSTGTTVADQDRPWLAADQRPGSNRVYLLFHNLASGSASHNMYVSTSTDGGASFGAPVPVTVPGNQAWNDLQCADSGGPSNIFVAPPGSAHPGRVYVAWNTRSSGQVGGVDTSASGGCGASATGTFEINVVGATRIWLAYSDTPANPGSWHDSLGLDDNAAGKLVSYQLAPGALDTAGNVYVVYDESLHAYPNYDGAPVKYIWSGPDLMKWSVPVTVAPGGGPGHVLPHIVVGSPGNLDLAYWTGQQDGSAIHWYETVAQVFGAMSATPSIQETRVSTISSDTGTASFLMGACNQSPGTSGVVNGTACNRSADVWGIALTPGCELTVAWPVRNNDKTSLQATYVTQQTGGTPVCKATPAAVAYHKAKLRARHRKRRHHKTHHHHKPSQHRRARRRPTANADPE
jgi:hypothetical protein